MNAITKFSTENVLRDAFFTYAKYVDEAAQADPVISTECKPFVDELKEAVLQLDYSMMLTLKLPQTDEITEESAWRLSCFRLFKRMVLVACRSNNPAERAAGAVLKQVLVDNRFDIKGKMDYVSGALFNLCQDLVDRNAEAVAAISATKVVGDMKRSNDNVMQLVSNRNALLSEREKNRVGTAREQVVKAMDNLYLIVNARALQSTSYIPFIKYVNTYIDRMKRAMNIKTRKENSEKPDNNGGGNTTTTPPTTTPQDFTPEQLRQFPVLPALYGSVEEITNPNSLISPFNPLSQNFKLSNLLPGTPAPTDGEVPEGKIKVKFDREEEVEQERRIRREVRRLLRKEGVEETDPEDSEDTALLDTKPFYVWYDTGLSIQTQGNLPPLFPGFHWYDLEHVLDTEHYVVRAVRNPSPEEGEQEEVDLTAGMLWPSDRPAPDGWCVVTFRPVNGEPITKLYRQGATIVSQGFLPENEEGYIWSGIYSKLTGSTHTVEEVEE